MQEAEAAEVFAFESEAELADQAFEFYVADDQIGLAGCAVSNDGALDVRNDGLDVGLVEAKNGGAVKRDAIHKLREGVLNIFQRSVLIEMLAIDGGDYRDDGREEQEAAVAFVGFHDEKFAFAKFGGGAGLIDAAADDERGIEMRGGEYGGDDGSGGGFSVGDGDAVFQAHQFGKHLGAGNHRDLHFVGFDDFRIVGDDG